MVRCCPAEQTWYKQQDPIEEIKNQDKLKELDEETLRAMVRAAVKNGTPGDDKIRRVLQDATDGTSCTACKRRAFEDTGKDRSEQCAAGSCRWNGTSTAVKAGLQDGGTRKRSGVLERGQKLAFMERLTQRSLELSSAWQEERECEGNEETTAFEFMNLWNRFKPRRWNTMLQKAYKCDIEGCGNHHIQFKTTQLLFEVVRGVEGGRTRAVCFDSWEKRDKALGNEASPSTFRFAQAQNPSADGQTSR